MDANAESFLQGLTSKGDKVGLKGILRGEAASSQPAMGSYSFPEFSMPGRTPPPPKPASEAELRMREMEQRVQDLERQLALQKNDTLKQVQAAEAKGKAAGITQGIAEGESKATQQHSIQLDNLRQEVAGILQSLNEAYVQRTEEIAQQSFELAIGVARKLWSLEAELHPERIADVLTEAFSHIGQAESVVVHLHPLDVQVANEKQSLWQPINSSLKNVQVVEDERMERGGCWVESAGGGTVDLRLEQTWIRLEEILRGAYAAGELSSESSSH